MPVSVTWQSDLLDKNHLIIKLICYFRNNQSDWGPKSTSFLLLCQWNIINKIWQSLSPEGSVWLQCILKRNSVKYWNVQRVQVFTFSSDQNEFAVHTQCDIPQHKAPLVLAVLFLNAKHQAHYPPILPHSIPALHSIPTLHSTVKGPSEEFLNCLSPNRTCNS